MHMFVQMHDTEIVMLHHQFFALETTSWEDLPSYHSLSPLLSTEEFNQFNPQEDCAVQSLEFILKLEHETHTCTFIRGYW